MSDHEQGAATEVEIFGAVYVIRAGHEAGHLTRLAAEVDRRMRELAGHTKNAEPGRLAVLAALNLADEMSRNRRDWDGERGEIEARVKSLAGQLERLLEDGKSGKKRGRATTKIESRGTP
ncbi:MAG TPA: cell division protein ZapA [Thermoanaerobaculia bacterium]|nr:cell division protein ZapA [Thermoanaerobaculia bacterium]